MDQVFESRVLVKDFTVDLDAAHPEQDGRYPLLPDIVKICQPGSTSKGKRVLLIAGPSMSMIAYSP